MKYKIIVDKQPRTNPTAEKREYEIDIEELRCKGNVADSLIITKDEDYVMRRLSLSEYQVLSVLSKPVKEPLQDINIELFEGENYIYLFDMVGNKFYAEYLVKNDFTDMYVTTNQMNSAINETAGKIEISVNQKLTEYATSEELEGAVTTLNSTITQTAEDINLEVSKKVNDEELTGANIALRINNDTSEAQINADKININGAISANGNFKVDTNGNMECTNGTFTGGNVNLKDDGTNHNPCLTIESTNYLTSISSSGMSISNNNFPSVDYLEGIFIDLTESTEPLIMVRNRSEMFTFVKGSGIETPILTQTSREETKKNFEKFENGLDILKQVDIYKYNLKHEEDTRKKHIGFVIGNNYKYSHEITSEDKEGKEVGADIYSMISVLWKAVQELTVKVEKLEQEVQNGEN